MGEPKEFSQISWGPAMADDCRRLVRLWVREDLGRQQDWTTVGLVAADQPGRAAVVVRCPGVLCGMTAAAEAIDEMQLDADWTIICADGDVVDADATVAVIEGQSRDLLTAERLLLNLIGRLSGVATLTRRYLEAMGPATARLYDTRKTTPGWRRLEKFAVRCGGGHNHRRGLDDAILIKDNHLALAGNISPGEAIRRLHSFVNGTTALADRDLLIEVEVDRLEQLEDALHAGPDIVMLDNMDPDQLRDGVARRDSIAPAVQLEASGGINLETIREVAATGVERISVGALTHSAVNLDVGLDWRE